MKDYSSWQSECAMCGDSYQDLLRSTIEGCFAGGLIVSVDDVYRVVRTKFSLKKDKRLFEYISKYIGELKEGKKLIRVKQGSYMAA